MAISPIQYSSNHNQVFATLQQPDSGLGLLQLTVQDRKRSWANAVQLPNSISDSPMPAEFKVKQSGKRNFKYRLYVFSVNQDIFNNRGGSRGCALACFRLSDGNKQMPSMDNVLRLTVIADAAASSLPGTRLSDHDGEKLHNDYTIVPAPVRIEPNIIKNQLQIVPSALL